MKQRAVVDGEHFDALLADLDTALGELLAAAGGAAGGGGAGGGGGGTPELWVRAKPGKWTAGQHVDHVGVTLGLSAAAFDERMPVFRSGALPERPRRGFLQSLWIWLVVKRGKLPRGGRAPKMFQPSDSPDRAATLEKIRRLVDAHRAMGAEMSPADRDRLWIANPFLPQWQYTLPEVIRVHAVHARHHARLVREIPHN